MRLRVSSKLLFSFDFGIAAARRDSYDDGE